MYASFFGLRELPFNNTPDPRFFFSTPDHEEALASLIYGISEDKGFVLLTGEVGSGKTLVTRLMLHHFGDGIIFASINNTQITANDLLSSLCAEFKIDTPRGASNAELIHALQDFLLAGFAANKPVVLVLDEAQALARQAFEQVRMIGNLEADDAKLLQIIIIGQPELRERFEASDMRQLRQRIFRSFHLGALTREQTEGYIRHRLGVAGARHAEEVLEASAIDVVFEFSQGVPRLINTACDNVMLSAYAADRKPINGEFARQSILQMMTASQGGSRCLPPPWAFGGGWRGPAVNERFLDDDMEPTGRLCGDATWRLSQDVENLARDRLTRLAHEARRICEDRTRKLTQDAEHVSRECLERLTTDARELCAQVLEQSPSGDSLQTMAQLARQSARTGRLAVTLREVLDKIERRARDLDRNAPLAVARGKPSAEAARPSGQRILEKTRDLDRQIHNNRSIVDEVRSLLKAVSDAQPRFSLQGGDAESAFTPSARRPASRLAEEVGTLTALIEEVRSGPTHHAVDVPRP